LFFLQAGHHVLMSRMTPNAMSRRHLLTLIGKNLGAAAMMQGMSTLGFAATSTYAGPIRLDGAPKGTRILVLGAGMAGLVAAFELRNAGYHVQILEYNNRAGGRAWTVRVAIAIQNSVVPPSTAISPTGFI
jgi:monoamine oxidase